VDYKVTAGAIPIPDNLGAAIGAVSFIAYVLEEKNGRKRPITFALNGGPGRSSTDINFGGLGPRRLIVDPATSRIAKLVDNPNTWLPFTDLVFVDAMGTGFSRSFLPEDPSHEKFFRYDSDISYLAQAIFDWLQQHGRLDSEKHLVGESYSGYRGPRLLEYLQNDLGVFFEGLVLLSPLMNVDTWVGQDVLPSPLIWISTLPTVAAAELERKGHLSASSMAPIEEFARSDYAIAILDGWRNTETLAVMVDKLVPLTGLSREYLTRVGGRIEAHDYLREIYRGDRKLAYFFDVNVSYGDPYPFSGRSDFEASSDSTVPARTAAAADYITKVVRWKPTWPYMGNNRHVNGTFEWSHGTEAAESYSSLRRILVENTKLRVLIAHGYTDLACPYFADVIALDQVSPDAGRDRLRFTEYPGGHMFYNRPPSLAAFTLDASRDFQ
jgi:carboxypeptidase C (cathepsin A)